MESRYELFDVESIAQQKIRDERTYGLELQSRLRGQEERVRRNKVTDGDTTSEAVRLKEYAVNLKAEWQDAKVEHAEVKLFVEAEVAQEKRISTLLYEERAKVIDAESINRAYLQSSDANQWSMHAQPERHDKTIKRLMGKGDKRSKDLQEECNLKCDEID